MFRLASETLVCIFRSLLFGIGIQYVGVRTLESEHSPHIPGASVQMDLTLRSEEY